MKKVDCPHCRKSIYSEYFVVGEEFPCPSCEVSLRVDRSDDLDASVSVVVDRFASGLFSRVVEGKGILLTQRDIMTFGEVLAAGLDVARWPALPPGRIEAMHQTARAALEACPKDDPFADVLRLRVTLLDIYRAGVFRDGQTLDS